MHLVSRVPPIVSSKISMTCSRRDVPARRQSRWVDRMESNDLHACRNEVPMSPGESTVSERATTQPERLTTPLAVYSQLTGDVWDITR